MDRVSRPAGRSFVEGFPEQGIWTALGLGRGQFFAILALSLAVFLFFDGPVWQHLRGAHFARIAVSYAVIITAPAPRASARSTACTGPTATSAAPAAPDAAPMKTSACSRPAL
jgi:hypothetical protein